MTRWRKSSRSGGSVNTACVEVAFGAAVGVRDSKNAPGPELDFSADAWRRFVSSIPWTA